MLYQLLSLFSLALTINSLPTPAPFAISTGQCSQFYIVRPGDSFFSIGSDLGIPIGFLKEINADIAPNPNLIFPGMEVCIAIGPIIPVPLPFVPPPYHPIPPPAIIAPFLLDCNGYPLPGPLCIDNIIVLPGDTLNCIASKIGIHPLDLISINPQIPNPDLIFPGQTVCIAVAPFGGKIY
jgi:LysM repeat protein